ncbi:glycoside hydrolase N-terminal domain-containing protein [Rathayibacter caricis]|uniref:glycosyl hydrolase family 95 catalytic domain-containing protein n=1 Tax=Rathayibacter caricis TaxID=110936 RepID=UPI001FB432D9|nr:glycoside hydrolase N-terminal domain-containing protein [Rathayibacter caricis]MCJ1697808.1 glycoside hydrolase N-terminal domain-containing protein [Rathayibacter caricis]
MLVHYDMSHDGDRLTDRSGRGLHARLVGVSDNDFGLSGTDQTLTFNEGGHVELPDFIGSEESVIIELRYTAGSVDNEPLFSLGTTSDRDYLRFHPRVGSEFMWEAKHDGAYYKFDDALPTSEGGFTTATAVLRSDATMAMAIDGQLRGTRTTSVTAPAFTPTGDVLGYLGKPVWNGDPYFSGTLSEVVVRTYREVAPPASSSTKVVSTTYPSRAEGRDWGRSSMITGNGLNGALIAGNPTNDTVLFQNITFNLPNDNLRRTPDISGYLEGNRRSLIDGGVTQIDPSYQMQWDYGFHPGHELNLRVDDAGPVYGNSRWTDYETGEVGVNYVDEKGAWERRTFTSRTDDVVVTHLTRSSTGTQIDLDLDITPLDDMAVEAGEIDRNLRFRQIAAPDGSYIGQVAHYPSYSNSELRNGGFAGVTYVVTRGGSKERVETGVAGGPRAVPGSTKYGIAIRGAEEVFLVTRSARDVDMGEWDRFAGQNSYPVVDELVAGIRAVIEQPQYQDGGSLSYANLLAPHALEHGREFNAVALDLAGSDADSSKSNEALISAQQRSANTLNAAMVERSFNAGRYGVISSSGFSVPRLGGMWTPAWNPAWQGDWTLDANLNLQMAGANTLALDSEMSGYLNFLLRTVPDWEDNAANVYGMQDAIMAPPRTDSDSSALYHYSENGGSYPFQYWNAGASWVLQPVYEYWQTHGDETVTLPGDIEVSALASILSPNAADLPADRLAAIQNSGRIRLVSDLLLPLLTKQANFWEQLVDPRYFEDSAGTARFQSDKTALAAGEHYLLLPCFSPENTPANRSTPVAMNCSMDIAAAQDGLRMAIAAERHVNGADSPNIRTWQELSDRLPPVRYDATGALKEWSLDRYTEQHAHRHISQAYFAWPAHDSQTSPEIAEGLATALSLRKATAGDKSSGHGWLHMGLVDARLKNHQGTTEALLALLSQRAYYSSFTTNHNVTGDSAYVADILHTVPTLLLESLIYSDTGSIQVLPALPAGVPAGSVTGSLARTQAEIPAMSWNIPKATASVTVRSATAQTIAVSSGQQWSSAVIDRQTVRNTGAPLTLTFAEGQAITIDFTLGTPTDLPVAVIPSVTSESGANTAGWHRSPVSVRFTTDSDDATVQYRLGDAGAWAPADPALSVTTDGVTTLNYRAVRRGTPVTGSEGELEIKLDRTAPLSSVTTDPASGSTTVGRKITAHFTAIDTTSGITSTEYSVDAGATWTAGSDVSFTAAGEHPLLYRATDAAGNVESAKTVVLTVTPADSSTTRPNLTVTASGRCIAGKVVLTVVTRNGEAVPVTLHAQTPYGSKDPVQVQAGKAVSQAFTTRLPAVPAGSVSVKGTAAIDGRSVTSTTQAGFPALSCR